MPTGQSDMPTKLDDENVWFGAKSLIELGISRFSEEYRLLSGAELNGLGGFLISLPLYAFVLAEEAAIQIPRHKDNAFLGIKNTIFSAAAKIKATNFVADSVGKALGLVSWQISVASCASEVIRRITEETNNPYDKDTDFENWCDYQAGYCLWRFFAIPAIGLNYLTDFVSNAITDPIGTESFLDKICQDIAAGKYQGTDVENYTRAALRTGYLDFLDKFLKENAKEVLKDHRAVTIFIVRAKRAFENHIGIVNNKLTVLKTPDSDSVVSPAPVFVDSTQAKKLSDIFDNYQKKIEEACKTDKGTYLNNLKIPVPDHLKNNSASVLPAALPGNFQIKFNRGKITGYTVSTDLLGSTVKQDAIAAAAILALTSAWNIYKWEKLSREEKTMYYIKEYGLKKGHNSGIKNIYRDKDAYITKSLRKCFWKYRDDRSITLICAACLYLIEHGKVQNHYQEWAALDFANTLAVFEKAYQEHVVNFLKAMANGNKHQACVSASRMQEMDPGNPITWLAAGQLMEKFRVVYGSKRDVYISESWVWNFEGRLNNYPDFELKDIALSAKQAYNTAKKQVQNNTAMLTLQISQLDNSDSNNEQKKSLQELIKYFVEVNQAILRAQLNLEFCEAIGDYSSPRPGAFAIQARVLNLAKRIENQYGVNDTTIDMLTCCYTYLNNWQEVLRLHKIHFGEAIESLSAQERNERAKLMYESAKTQNNIDQMDFAIDILFSQFSELKKDRESLSLVGNHYLHRGQGEKAEQCFGELFKTDKENNMIQRCYFGSLLMQGKLDESKAFLDEVNKLENCDEELKLAYQYMKNPPCVSEVDSQLQENSPEDYKLKTSNKVQDVNKSNYLTPKHVLPATKLGLATGKLSFLTLLSFGVLLKNVGLCNSSSRNLFFMVSFFSVLNGLSTTLSELTVRELSGKSIPALTITGTALPFLTMGLFAPNSTLAKLAVAGGVSAGAFSKLAKRL